MPGAADGPLTVGGPGRCPRDVLRHEHRRRLVTANTKQAAPQLPREVEVAVIGAGIVGCATAYFLAKAGVPVAVFEKGRVAGEQSSRNWGWVRKQGRDPRELPAIIESLNIWERLEQELQADLGWYRGGVTYVATTEADLARFEHWLELAKPYRLDSRMLSAAETREHVGEIAACKGALFTASDGRAEPAKVVPALARAAERLGVRIFTNCAVRTIETQAGRVSGIVTERGAVACRAVVCAAGAWSGLFNRNLDIVLPQLRVRGSVLRTGPGPLITQSAVWCDGLAFRRREDGGYTVAGRGALTFDIVPDAFRFFPAFLPGLRMNRKELRLRLSSEFWKQWKTPSHWNADATTAFEQTRVLAPPADRGPLEKLMARARRLFPKLQNVGIAETWAGMIEATPDALPVMCAVERPEGYFIVTGFSGHGFGMGPAAGLLMSELVLKGEATVDMTPFRLSRFSDGSDLTPYSTV